MPDKANVWGFRSRMRAAKGVVFEAMNFDHSKAQFVAQAVHPAPGRWLPLSSPYLFGRSWRDAQAVHTAAAVGTAAVLLLTTKILHWTLRWIAVSKVTKPPTPLSIPTLRLEDRGILATRKL
jgi:hypothetical protein